MKIILLLTTLILLPISEAYSHARFLPGGNTPARNNNPGLKVGPCGNIPKAQTPTLSFKSGQTIKLQWEETINHPGYFEFSISSDNDQSFTLLLTVPDTQNDNNLPHRYEADLKLPDGLTCSNCTLQMVQQMTENPNNPRPYFSCVDMEITSSGSATPSQPIDESKNTPEPAPEDCH